MKTQTDEKKNFKATLNLPQTAFAMEAKLTANEPARLAKWREMGLYEKLMSQRAGGKKWVLHDGPPFANGDIHIGQLFNKTLKDVILRFRSMQGYRTPYVPGWDCHGLPIEHKIQQDLGPKLRQMSVVEIRKLCFEYADKYCKIQSEQFQRLGILGEWANPYLTMSPQYEAQILEVFARFVEARLVEKQLKPVPWSIENQTALADAELEYQDVSDNSVYVEFPGSDDVHYLVWTTTPWTLPANLAIAVNPKVEYAIVSYERSGHRRSGVVAKALLERVFAQAGVHPQVEKTMMGEELLGRSYRHPFINRTGKLVAADYVTITDGTGLVHTAPGHGEDDYMTAVIQALEVYSPVLANGRFDDTVPEWIRGKKVFEANSIIIEHLKDADLLFAQEKISHSYPHDWRSKKPIIFRATEQWFIRFDRLFSPDGGAQRSLKQRALSAVKQQIDFVPKWGQARLLGMLESRPDWCISRQRAWGLPIPVFYNEKGEALLTPQSVRAVAKRFAEKGSDAWFSDSPADLLGDFDPGPNFPKDKLRKEKDIFDVWFESGSSWHAVLEQRPELHFPADLYLEGSDQHRGWFQLSLLLSLGATGQPPFKQVLTHGFIVKPDGTKVSKSDKEYVTAMAEVNRHGADLLRLWCCSVDYQNDIPASPAALQEFGDKYRKIRNTLRYLLSNLYDFKPENELNVPDSSLDGWMLHELDDLIEAVTKAYDSYSLLRAFRLLHDFCSVQVSTIYSTAMKDRLYCDAADSPRRRRSQYVMFKLVDVLTRMLAPMLVFTADEAWEYIPCQSADQKLLSVHLARMPEPRKHLVSNDVMEEWRTLMRLREEATGQLDGLKKSVGMNKALDAELIYHISRKSSQDLLKAYGDDLEDLVGAGYHSVVEAEASKESYVDVKDRRQDYKACARSWKRRPDVGQDAQYPDLSLRDAAVVRAVERTAG
jgi:isoleucyl-tRNA synthetase